MQAAKEGLSKLSLSQEAFNCATQVAKKMGATDAEMVMVSGFAGGMGLSGNGCGALASAIWMNSLKWIENNPGKSAFGNPKAKATLKRFLKVTNKEMLCQKICSQRFDSIEDHSEFIKKGGCQNLISSLSFS